MAFVQRWTGRIAPPSTAGPKSAKKLAANGSSNGAANH